MGPAERCVARHHVSPATKFEAHVLAANAETELTMQAVCAHTTWEGRVCNDGGSGLNSNQVQPILTTNRVSLGLVSEFLKRHIELSLWMSEVLRLHPSSLLRLRSAFPSATLLAQFVSVISQPSLGFIIHVHTLRSCTLVKSSMGIALPVRHRGSPLCLGKASFCTSEPAHKV